MRFPGLMVRGIAFVGLVAASSTASLASDRVANDAVECFICINHDDCGDWETFDNWCKTLGCGPAAECWSGSCPSGGDEKIVCGAAQ